ncbi:lipopolysaccharide biosynthesis protein [Hominifimenecus sp. rT4P-3]|uniref:lipopolysaccharide biosynthesis protein n=1 Tax=Hominifimenecus sp. rT4P-3 TaxID=3242979 RepID=UPI003DA219EC
MNRDRGVKNLFYSILGQVVTIGIGLLLPRFFILGYGSEVNGLLNSVNQIFSYFILLEAGIGAASLQALYRPVADGDGASICRIMAATKRYYDRASVFYLVGIALFAGIYTYFMAGEVPVPEMIGVIVFSGLGNVLNFRYQGKYKILLQAEGKKYIISNVQTLAQVLISLAKLIGVWLGLPIVTVMGLGFAASLVQTLYYIWYIQKHYQWLNLSAEPDWKAVEQKNSVLVHQVSQLIFQNTDVLILTIVCGLKVVSVYSVYKMVVSAISQLTYQFSESFLFILGQEYGRNRKRYEEYLDCFDVIYTAASFLLLTVTYLLYPSFIDLYTNGVRDVSYGGQWLPLLFVGIELLSSCRRAAQNTIDVAGHFRKTASRSAAEAAINLAVSLALVGIWGIYGVLLGTVAALLYRTNDMIWYVSKKLLKRSTWRFYRVYLVNFAVFFLAAAAGTVWPVAAAGWSGFLGFGAALTIGMGVVYGGVSMLCFPAVRKRVKETMAGMRKDLR